MLFSARVGDEGRGVSSRLTHALQVSFPQHKGTVELKKKQPCSLFEIDPTLN